MRLTIAPLPFSPQDGVHWVVYSPFNKSDFFAKLEHYHDHQLEAQAIAKAGQLLALRHHRTVSRVDYILHTAELNRTRTMDLGTLNIKRTPPRWWQQPPPT